MSHAEQHERLPDPLIDEVRAVRKALCDRFGNDVARLGEYVRQFGERYRHESGQPLAPSIGAAPHPADAGRG